MKVIDQYQTIFSEPNLKTIYEENILLSSATGVDNMTHKIFRGIYDEQVSIISRKALSGQYEFTKYKLKLISKGRGKVPREISIPTVRDRIALRALCDFLQCRFSESLDFSLPQQIISEVKSDVLSKKYSAFIKLDVSNFYPSIKHDKLLSRLRKRIRDESILNVIENAISSPTVSRPSSKDQKATIGVPQGLSISNVLASIFLSNIDKRFSSRINLKYYRYVDDLFILCKSREAKAISDEVISQFRRLGLKIHCPIKVPEKSSIGNIGVDDFSYLGYYFDKGIVSARSGSIDKLRESILSIFTGFKHSNIKSKEFLEWRLNLRITGCIFTNKSKGWLFFFSEINNEKLLHELDNFVRQLCRRYSVDILPKSFVRSFYQIKHNKHETRYIPNFDLYTIKDMSHVLNIYFNKSTKGMSNLEIEQNFKRRISRQVKDLETDVLDFGY